MSQSLILIDSVFCLLGEGRKKQKTKREAAGGFFPRARGRTYLAGCAGQDFHGC
jgi:hypothetical protein